MSRPAIDEPRTWQRVRRYAVPAAMIAECAEANRAGDWRAACVAGRVDVDLDLAGVKRAHGATAAVTIETDLALLDPDLLRWHLPRALGGRTSLATHKSFLLSVRDGRIGEGDPFLVVHTPKTVDGSQRLRLTVETSLGQHVDLPPAYWSHAHAGLLASAYGGSPVRMPGFEPDGAVRPAEAYATRIDPSDPATRTEFAERCLDDDYPDEAWRVQGIDLEITVRAGQKADRIPELTVIALGGLAAECHRLAARYGVSTLAYGDRWNPPIRIDRAADGTLAASVVANKITREWRRIPAMIVAPPIDLELLRLGLIKVPDLHPLVRSALFPAAPTSGATAEPASRPTHDTTAEPARSSAQAATAEPATRPTHDTTAEPARGPAHGATGEPGAGPVERVPLDVSVAVRCGREWHTVTHGGGRLDLPAHTADEIRREETLKALGGAAYGCFATRSAWHGGTERLPRALRLLRRHAWLRAQHGGARVLGELLDAGLDPLVVDGRGNTLLHQLRAMDHTELLPRLLAAGVPINAGNRRGRTPLHVAVGDGGSPELVRALLDAGADPLAGDDSGTTPVELSGWKSEDYSEGDDADRHPQARIHQLLLERTST